MQAIYGSNENLIRIRFGIGNTVQGASLTMYKGRPSNRFSTVVCQFCGFWIDEFKKEFSFCHKLKNIRIRTIKFLEIQIYRQTNIRLLLYKNITFENKRWFLRFIVNASLKMTKYINRFKISKIQDKHWIVEHHILPWTQKWDCE